MPTDSKETLVSNFKRAAKSSKERETTWRACFSRRIDSARILLLRFLVVHKHHEDHTRTATLHAAVSKSPNTIACKRFSTFKFQPQADTDTLLDLFFELILFNHHHDVVALALAFV